MRARLALSIALGAAVVPAGVDAAAVDRLRDCAAHAKAAVGLAALEAQCPALEGALAELGYLETRDDGWRRRLTPTGLGDLAALAERYRSPRPSALADVKSVRGIVDGLARERPPVPQSWWDALKDWVGSWLSRHESYSFSWLNPWLDRLASAAGIAKIVVYGLLVAVLAAALGFVAVELRGAGFFSRPTRPRPVRPRRDAAPADRHSLAELDGASAFDKPAILLRLLVGGLATHGRLQAERHLTHRELIVRAELDDADQRRRFTRVAGLAERVLYGPRMPFDEEADSIVQDGRVLLLQLKRSLGHPT